MKLKDCKINSDPIYIKYILHILKWVSVYVLKDIEKETKWDLPKSWTDKELISENSNRIWFNLLCYNVFEDTEINVKVQNWKIDKIGEIEATSRSTAQFFSNFSESNSDTSFSSIEFLLMSLSSLIRLHNYIF